MDERATVAAALEANAGNIRATARETGVPPRTIEGWVNRNTLQQGLDPAVVHQKLEQLLRDIARVQRRALNRTLLMLREASARDAAIIFGIYTEKHQLVRGAPTEIIAQEGMGEALHDPEIVRQAADVTAAIARRRSGGKLKVVGEAQAADSTKAAGD